MINFLSPRYDQTLGYDGPRRRYDPRILADVADAITRSSPDFMLITLGGSEHFYHGAVNNPRPFQFILPDEPMSDCHPGAELVPYDLAREQFRVDLSGVLYILPQIRVLTPAPMLYLSPPPPVGPSHLIAAHMPPMWRTEAQMLGVPEPPLRYRLWQLFTDLADELCRDADIDFLPVPPLSIDKGGFLEERYRKDSLHANEEYGQLVLSEALKRVRAQRKQR